MIGSLFERLGIKLLCLFLEHLNMAIKGAKEGLLRPFFTPRTRILEVPSEESLV